MAEIMNAVSARMGVNPPTHSDLTDILMELDEDYDGKVDQEEFLRLVVCVLGSMVESEEKM